MARLVVLSLRPQFARAIYQSTKHYEFRRVRTTLQTGDCVLIYESAPTSKITGEFVAGKVVIGTPSTVVLMETNEDSRRSAADYLSGAHIATAIEVVGCKQWEEALHLQDVLPGMYPPQSYSFVLENKNGIFCSNQR